ncbi:dihydrofolate reductase family protein [Rhizosphaericola mali]|uniref:Uncharacterized protein n=1 Tax=Rhizosphaericola mali TaxID=2545455 RepID=A0A5P2FY39_9BACT|nr:dihydrofolate reductase [Rhizosphaericola mali]QES87857.1 hypothetical protein E0W69_003980 [Rhizosphaericola mali]
MKVTIVANVSANGRILLSDNPYYPLPPEVMGFYLKMVKQIGTLVIGKRTFENFQRFPENIKTLFEGIEIIVLSNNSIITKNYRTIESPEKAVEFASAKGLTEIAIGGGTDTFNAFIESDLVTDIYLNVNPLITGVGSTLGNSSELNTRFSLKDYNAVNGFMQLHWVKEQFGKEIPRYGKISGM